MQNTYLPADQWSTLVNVLEAAHADSDPRNAIIIALAEVGFIVPDTCREDDEKPPLAA
ncbi:hypothetical protein [Mesorhizobium sp. RMAD-H1]|uniref:hypothetical protein n=1 Tax=Mesorhizobium sp. RMAD-H1 TaxID=2587065 RepID=UPI00161288B8|nr:hypothetical protein [Mesorhizobium sp. RMAD-H1]MBB2969809.1 hypothetical protein [Mesorhizobium sp. RMAD-H1]